MFVLAREDLGIEAFHGGRSERRQFGDDFIQNAPDAPNVTPVIVRHILPHLGTGIVRGACLCAQQSALVDLGDVQITQFDRVVFSQEHICALDVTMADFEIVERFESPYDLNEKVPDLFFIKISVLFLVFID